MQPLLPRRSAVSVFACVIASVLFFTTNARAEEEPAHFTLPSAAVGTTLDLSGKWAFKPSTSENEVVVPVPQMLSRIQWWLDDSEDFKKWEQNRLNALGFDTEKTDDGWYRCTFHVPPLLSERHVWIEFDGVAMQSRTFINGQLLG